MAEEVVGSFPYQEWAEEIQNALLGKGVQAEVSYAGPRAYPVLIDESDSEKAGEILSEIGYFTCRTGIGASMSGVLDWLPHEAVEEDDLRDALKKALEDKVEEMGDQQAAEGWSTPEDPDTEWVIAEFGNAVAVNGDMILEGNIPNPPADYELTRKGGRIPCSEAHVSMEHAVRSVAKEYQNYPALLIIDILNEIWKMDYKDAQEVPTSTSGSSEVYRKGGEDDEE